MSTLLERQTNNKPSAQIDPLAEAILRTLAYADLYDYAMTADEIQHYLIGLAATRAQVHAALQDKSRLDGQIARGSEFFTLKGRETLRGLRDSRRNLSNRLWHHARRYARLIAHLPFVRMVAVTGALAVNNAPEGDDIDFLIITAPGHLWTARGLIVLMVRLARLLGVNLCPNYLITENALVYDDRNLYSAHEIAQAIPLFGLTLFRRYQVLNCWVEDFLPNVRSCASIETELTLGRVGTWLKALGEHLLSLPQGVWLEHWEQTRKVAKLRSQLSVESDQSQFDADCCKGHFGGHARRALEEYERRWSRILDE